MMKQAGFEEISIIPKKISQELIDNFLPGSRAGEYVVSADIQAKKPVSHQSKIRLTSHYSTIGEKNEQPDHHGIHSKLL